MINFDYSLKKINFNLIRNNTFFMLDENLHLKTERVKEIRLLSPDMAREYNCYDFNNKEFKCLSGDTEVIVCDVDMTARPQR